MSHFIALAGGDTLPISPIDFLAYTSAAESIGASLTTFT